MKPKLLGLELHTHAPELNKIQLSNGDTIPAAGITSMIEAEARLKELNKKENSMIFYDVEMNGSAAVVCVADDPFIASEECMLSGKNSEVAYYLTQSEFRESVKTGTVCGVTFSITNSTRELIERSIAKRMTESASQGYLMSLYFDDKMGHLSGLSEEELMEEME